MDVLTSIVCCSGKMEEEPSTLENSDLNSNQGPAVCTEKIAPAILSGTGTWLRLSMPYFPKKSVVWRYFDLYESDGYSRADTERVVKCRLSSCKRKELRLDAQSSTKGMWEHLRNKHPDEAVRCENGCVTSTEECELLSVPLSVYFSICNLGCGGSMSSAMLLAGSRFDCTASGF